MPTAVDAARHEQLPDLLTDAEGTGVDSRGFDRRRHAGDAGVIEPGHR